MAKLTLKLEHDKKDNEDCFLGQDTYSPDVEMVFEVGIGSTRSDYIKAYAAFMYHVFGYSIKDLEELYQS